METCGGELDTGTQWDSQWALHRAPRVTLRSAFAVEGALNLQPAFICGGTVQDSSSSPILACQKR